MLTVPHETRAEVITVITQGSDERRVHAEIAFNLSGICVPIYFEMNNVPLDILPNQGERIPVKFRIEDNNKIKIVGYERSRLGISYSVEQ